MYHRQGQKGFLETGLEQAVGIIASHIDAMYHRQGQKGFLFAALTHISGSYADLGVTSRLPEDRNTARI
jgi:hypothetical protein